ncbi:Ninjurin-1 [Manis pentadactyla]|nr:Ninjurin-1 [Manis pentadactyla]
MDIGLPVRYDLNNPAKHAKLDFLNNLATGLVFIIVVGLRCPHHTLLQLPDLGSHLTPEVYSLPEALPETTGALTGPTGLCPGLSLPWLGHQGPVHGLLCPQLLSLECGLVTSETELASPQVGLSPRPHGRPKDGGDGPGPEGWGDTLPHAGPTASVLPGPPVPPVHCCECWHSHLPAMPGRPQPRFPKQPHQ